MRIYVVAIACLASLTNPCLASISGSINEPKELLNARTPVAIVFNRETGKLICQISTVGRQDLVPSPLKAANEADAVTSDLPFCSSTETAQIQYAANYATFDHRTAIAPVVAMGLYCFATALAGGSATLLSTAVNNNALRGSDSFLGDAATGAVGGAATGAATMGFSFTLTLLTKMYGIGAVCGALGGLATNAIFYPVEY